MQYILFHTLYRLLWLITRLPLKWLYFFSSLCFPIIYYIVPYRKKIVLTNLRKSFPEWDEAKVRTTAKQFYRQFCDTMVESAALFFFSEQETLRRMKYKNPELLLELIKKGKSVILMMGHFGNWELCIAMPRFIDHEVVAVYKTLTNKYFDNFFIKARERYGLKAIPMEKTVRYLAAAEKEGKNTLSFFAADQRPPWSEIQHWITFMNQDTPVILGAEKLAKMLNMAVVYLKITPVSKGHYEAEFDLICEDPSSLENHTITEIYFQTLESSIRQYPHYWLWTHNRWKHDKKKYIHKPLMNKAVRAK
jgi:Kdo2-lipid IVA lauroyltransferase/acyltransferase